MIGMRRHAVPALGAWLVAAAAAAQSPPPPALPAADEAAVYTANEPARASKEGKVLRAYRLRTAPAIDARLSDEAWTFAEAGTGLVQRDPDNGQPMTESTRVQVAYDDRFLYIAIVCVDSAPASINAGLGRRDESPPTDTVTFAFDPRHDHQTGFAFQTNPSGWQGDFSYYDDDRTDRDYNAVWEVRAEVTDTGWIAEARIPFSQIRFTASPLPGQVWGFNVQRQIRRKNEGGAWVARPRGERGEVSLFGHLVFSDPIAPPRRLELVPYALARSTHRSEAAQEGGAAAGVDMRMGLGTGATLSATINPDFAQVEQDPAVLNLSVFETFFPEKRPFFLEDSRTFVPPYGLFQVFHSRRIGRAPGRLPLGEGETAVDRPDETTILGAAKLTGKTGRWTYGALSAATGREFADVDAARGDGTGVVRLERLIEPGTAYNVMRVQRDIGNGSNAGVITTGVLREKLDDAFTGGFDYNLRWNDNKTSVNGHWVATHAPGPGGIKTSGGGVTNFSTGGKYVNFGSHYDHFGRDFRVNDLGFFRGRANRNQADAFFEAGNPDPWKIFRRVGLFSSGGRGWTDERLVFGGWAEVGTWFEFLNYWGGNVGTGRNPQVLDDLDTRGGPPIVRPANRYVWFNAYSDSRKKWRVNFGGNIARAESGGHGGAFYTSFSIQPSDRLQASVSGNYNFGLDAAQWIRNEDVNADAVTDHVYGRLRRNVVDLTFRSTYAFSRDLTIQMYLQPFVAVGAYDQIRRLAAPRSYEFEPVALGSNPDFSTASLRGNVIMRWEYVRGSTLFVVWDLSQADASRPGDFRPLRNLGRAFRADSTHVLMVKLSYWVDR